MVKRAFDVSDAREPIVATSRAEMAHQVVCRKSGQRLTRRLGPPLLSAVALTVRPTVLRAGAGSFALVIKKIVGSASGAVGGRSAATDVSRLRRILGCRRAIPLITLGSDLVGLRMDGCGECEDTSAKHRTTRTVSLLLLIDNAPLLS
jgi:hypothetical protein